MNPALLQKGSNSFRTDSEIKDHEGCRLTNSAYPVKGCMIAAFHQGLHCLLRYNINRGHKYIIIFKFQPHTLKIQNGQFHTYFINIHGNIHKNEKG